MRRSPSAAPAPALRGAASLAALSLISVSLTALPLRARAAVEETGRVVTPKPATIVVTPSGATLTPGQAVAFSAQVLDKLGNPVPAATVTWTSNKTAVLTVDGNGNALAVAPGLATITVKAGAKNAKLTVAVLTPAPPGGRVPDIVAAVLGQVDGVLADDDWVYWTEVNTKVARIRKSAKSGGPIYDLVSEPARDSRGVGHAYVQLQQMGDRLYWSRQSLGFFDHWSIRCISKSGGAFTEILPEDASIDPISPSGWRVCGKHVVAALVKPGKIHLATNTTFAAYDTEAGTWAPLVTGRFQQNRNYVLAADDTTVFLRGVTTTGTTEYLSAAPGGSVNSFQTLLTLDDTDFDAGELGTTDGTRLFYWTRRAGNGDRIVTLPTAGGTQATVPGGGTFGTGLSTDGANLYWAKAQTTLVRLPVAGGTATTLLNGLQPSSSITGFALDNQSVYAVQAQSGAGVNIVRLPR